MIGIDTLGVLSGTGSLGPVPVSDDEVHVLIGLAAVPEMPVVLAHRQHHDSDTERQVAFARAADALGARGLVRAGAVHPAVADRLRTLGRPAWEVAVRRFHDGTVDRLGLAHGSAECGVSGAGNRTVTARVVPGGFVLDDADPGSVSPIVRMLGPAGPARTGGVSLPTARLSAALTEGAGDGARTTRRLAEAGVPAAEAALLGAALGPCGTFAEIVGIRHGDGATGPVGGPVTVFDTTAGRVVGTSSAAPDGTSWTTLSSGTDGVLRRALGDLVARLERDRADR